MTPKHYRLVDVFTTRLFGGNPLAVFPEGAGLSDDTMQAIARELNLSETTFVLSPDDPANDCRVRIFTPERELPMAGHPTVGTAFVLAKRGKTPLANGQTVMRFEEGVGVIPVTLDMQDGQPAMIWMQQPEPRFGPHAADRAAVAAALSLKETDLDAHLPVEVVSTGVPFLFVPLASVEAVERIRLRLDLWDQAVDGLPTREVFVFARESDGGGSTVRSRMFAPTFGIMEDPATGSASGPLGCYLVKYGVVSRNPATILSKQGFEMGRPSYVHIEIERDGERFTRVAVGGQCVAVGGGYIEVETEADA